MNRPPFNKRLDPAIVLREAARVFGFSLENAPRHRTTKQVTIMRQVCCTMMRNHCHLSLPEVAAWNGMNSHSSVVTLLQCYKRDRDKPEIINGVQTTRRELHEQVFWRIGNREGWAMLLTRDDLIEARIR